MYFTISLYLNLLIFILGPIILVISIIYMFFSPSRLLEGNQFIQL